MSFPNGVSGQNAAQLAVTLQNLVAEVAKIQPTKMKSWKVPCVPKTKNCSFNKKPATKFLPVHEMEA